MGAFILAVVGGLNWGLVGIGELAGSNLNVVNLILGSVPMLESIVYILVGLSALYLVLTHKRDCRQCSSGMSQM
jgi:hypothetical protein